MVVDKLPQHANRFFTISNLLSLSRVALCVPFTIVMLQGSEYSRVWGAAIVVVAALTDKFDGVIARRYGQITEWGRILDPLADKIGVAVVALVLLALESIPGWFVLLLVLRDVIIFTGGMYVKTKTGIVLPSNELGKWTVGIVSATLLLRILYPDALVGEALIFLSVAMLFLSLGVYGKRFLEVIRKGVHGNA